jgi:hypothetical protein
MSDSTPSPLTDHMALARRGFLGRSAAGLAAISTLLAEDGFAQTSAANPDHSLPHFAGKAKRVIYLFQSGAPSQLDLFDHKPDLEKHRDADLPDSIRKGQRLTGMTSKQARFPIAPSSFAFARHGQSGQSISELLPETARIADRITILKTLHTEAINHDPAITFIQTGSQLSGRPSFGSWLSYGLGSLNSDLPAFVAMVSGSGGQPLYDRLWGSGFLPSKFQGVKFRSVGDPVLFLSNPSGLQANVRRRFLDDLARLNNLKLKQQADPEISTRMAQYELAFRMQTSVPELTDTPQSPTTSSSSTAKIPANPAPSLRTACWLDGCVNGASGSCSCSIEAGTSTPTCPKNSLSSVLTPIEPAPLWSSTSHNADYSRIRSSSGVENSAEPSTAKDD